MEKDENGKSGREKKFKSKCLLEGARDWRSPRPTCVSGSAAMWHTRWCTVGAGACKIPLRPPSTRHLSRSPPSWNICGETGCVALHSIQNNTHTSKQRKPKKQGRIQKREKLKLCQHKLANKCSSYNFFLLLKYNITK